MKYGNYTVYVAKKKGADQLYGYREADLRLCFRICKKSVFSKRGSYNTTRALSGTQSWYTDMAIFRLYETLITLKDIQVLAIETSSCNPDTFFSQVLIRLFEDI